MLRLVLLALYLIASPFNSSQTAPYGLNAPSPAATKQIGGGLDPDGSTFAGDLHGNLDPDGSTSTSDLTANLDPNG
jgi:hypothetical protein